MDTATVWWILAGGVVVAELVTGSIYLLMVAVGLAAGALAAHAGLGVTAQIVVSGLVMAIATGAWHAHVRSKRNKKPNSSADKNVNMDVGETVTVVAWNADGTAQVQYRGASWAAVLKAGATAAPGVFTIAEVHGSRLTLSPV